ncbi:MAG TPA: Flp family type IVb pilin [Stellaceae bacterium]|nr:Flp family type IVb pilin [Stellaceae bacterium]
MRTFTSRFASLASRFARNEQGANALEYALVMILVAFAIAVGAAALGTNLNTLFGNTATQVGNVKVPTL